MSPKRGSIEADPNQGAIAADPRRWGVDRVVGHGLVATYQTVRAHAGL